MHLVKPLWLTHGGELKDFEVYSCHVSADGKRLVTAAGDGFVRIWSTDAVYKVSDPEYTGPKQLAAISNHTGTIHTVRFSGNNRYLASGADDRIVCVYTLDPNPPPAAFGSSEEPPVENWRVFRRLIGHDNDVQDLGWSYDSSILVSVGLDSKVVVWSGHTFEKLKTLVQHQSHVKGITFDPANKYFATASDDRTVKIYRFTSPTPNSTAQDQVNNFVLEHSVSTPFISSPLTTYFRRCSWSPDGNHIAAANAVNGPVSSVAIVNRGSWDSDINLIGHERPVEVCAFSPRMFYREPWTAEQTAQGSAPPAVTVIACAGQDKTLSIWNTSFARPFVITHELTQKAISDVAWAPDGETLFLTSLDGSILVAMFEPGELGFAAPLTEIEKSLSKFGAGRKAGVSEGPEALRLEESSKAGELKGAQGRMGELMGDPGSHVPQTNGVNGVAKTNGITIANTPGPSTGSPAPQQPPQDPRIEDLKSRITYTKEGRKKIRPMLISTSSSLAESSLPQTQLVSGSAQNARSDAPHQILDLSKAYDGFPKGGLTGLLVGNKRKFAEIEGDEERRVEKRLAGAVRDGGAPVVMNSGDGLIPPSLATQAAGSIAPGVLRPAMMNPSLSVSQIRLAVPQVRASIVRTMDGADPTATEGAKPADDSVRLEVKNSFAPSRTGRAQDRDPARVACTKSDQALWQDYLPKQALLTTGNPNFWAVACEDGSIYIWTPAGRRLLNALVLESQPVILDCRGWHLMCISAVGLAYVWNIKTLSAPHPPVSLAPVLDCAIQSQGPHLTGSPGIIFARLNSEGRLVVALSNGDGYTYSPAMFVWQRLSESWWAVTSQYWNTTDSSIGKLQSSSPSNGQAKNAESSDMLAPENLSAGIIPLLERNTTNHTLLRGRAFFLQRLIKALLVAEGFEGFEASASVAHLENRVAAALSLGAKDEFRVYLLMYARRLGAEGLKIKVQELLGSLLGDGIDDLDPNDVDMAQPAEKEKGWFSTEQEICGWNRRQLLKEVVLVLGKHRDLQRTTVPFARLLGVIDEQAPASDEAMAVDTTT
ncbi:Hira-domain-containing protein [Eremomyces bilateralis CBS 781.70]|uniref:Protein HIR n=1 Tax=Eremomyces bilateralis CBS 781.70 TaxID=1392243 RepID=A0A6G1GHH0_9PEZI|nr:Hira-domain-containing protein [Eremomyces bilateralis CBS 781.70]KAF1817319.1 Hira-domain-containing protein [Eremomyces bilateralis CBS 781.70]